MIKSRFVPGDIVLNKETGIYSLIHDIGEWPIWDGSKHYMYKFHEIGHTGIRYVRVKVCDGHTFLEKVA